jgi:hypothetical protein
MELTKDSPVEDFINILDEIGKEKRQKIFSNFCRTCCTTLTIFEEKWCDEHFSDPRD